MIIKAVDLFCGAGGTSSGLYHACELMGFGIDLLAVNHWHIAIETHKTNHPDARYICATLENVDPKKEIKSGHLDILVASPECTHHSIARGGKPVNDQLRASAWHILRWVELLRIDNILIENVREFSDWGPTDKNGKPMKRRKGETYQAFLTALRSLNYTVEDNVLNAADYGDPTSRNRLFVMARRGNKKIVWPSPSHTDNETAALFDSMKPYRTAREIIDWGLPGESIFKRKKALAPATMARIAAGLRKYGGKNAEPFLVMMYGSNDARSVDRPMPTITAGGNHIGLCEPFISHYQGRPIGQSIDAPLNTITTKDRFALVEPFTDGEAVYDIRFRMLQPHELAAAMSFDKDYQFAGNKTDQVKQIGNAVPVRTATALCQSLLGKRSCRDL